MRILLTSILCHSGLMTHVKELANYLISQGIYVAIAFKRVNYLDTKAKEELLASLVDIPYLLYDTAHELEEFCLENNCQLIHAHSHATFKTASIVSDELHLPLVVTLHSVFPWVRFFPNTLQQASKIVAVGQAQALSATKFAPKIEVVPNGIDLKLFVPAKERHEDGKIHVLWYGRVDGRLSKGLQALDRLAPLLPEHIQIKALGSADFVPRNIELQPWTNEPVHYLQKAHITFAQSRALREAMACGSIGMLLGAGYGGLVTEEWLMSGRAVDAFREYRLPQPRPRTILRDILNLADLPNIENLRKDARQLAENYFDIEAMGQKTLQIYDSVRR